MIEQISIKLGEKRFWRWFNFLCFGLILLGSVQLVRITSFAGSGSNPIRRDIVQDYLIGRAILSGIDPLLTVPELFSHILPFEQYRGHFMPTESPHSPLAILVFLPFSLFSPKLASQLWVVASALCGFFSYRVLLKMLSIKRANVIAASCLSITILTNPGASDLLFGQWSYPQLLLISLFLYSLNSKRTYTCALMLFLAMAIRPILLLPCIYAFLKLDRKFKESFILVGLIAIALVAAILGLDFITDYPKAANAATNVWSGMWANISLPSLASNILPGARGIVGIEGLMPILPREITASIKLLGLFLSMTLAVFALYRARKAAPIDAIQSLLIISPILSPIAWDHYLVILTVPMVLSGRRLLFSGSPRAILFLLIVTVALFYSPGDIFTHMHGGIGDEGQIIPIALKQRLVYPVLTALTLSAWAIYPFGACRISGQSCSRQIEQG